MDRGNIWHKLSEKICRKIETDKKLGDREMLI